MTLADVTAPAELDDMYDFDNSPDDEIDDFLGLPAEAPVEMSRILVVDDDPTAAAFMRRLIEREGFSQVISVGDGRRALDAMSDHPPDVIVLDVHLPQVDGFVVLREIARHDQHTGKPTGVLAISGDATSATCQSMLWSGADDFIAKPFSSAEFSLRVRTVANRTRSLRRALAYSRFLEGRIRAIARR